MTFFPSLFLSFFLSSSSPSGHFVPISSLRQHLVSILCNLSKKAVKRPTDLVYANGPFVRNQHPKPPSHAPSHSPRTLRRRKGEKKSPNGRIILLLPLPRLRPTLPPRRLLPPLQPLLLLLRRQPPFPQRLRPPQPQQVRLRRAQQPFRPRELPRSDGTY